MHTDHRVVEKKAHLSIRAYAKSLPVVSLGKGHKVAFPTVYVIDYR